jgi:general L-amino acid transport system permease protein
MTAPKPVSFWNDPKRRAFLIQVIATIAVVGFLGLGIKNAVDNLTARGIASGFGFLGQRAGFAIVQHLIPFDESTRYIDAFFVGLINTALVSALAIFFASLLGLIVGLGRLSHNWLIAKLALAYVEVLRNIPLLLLIVVVYFMGLRPLPGPRQSLQLGDLVFLNNRGLFLPQPIFLDSAWIPLLAALVAMIAIFLYARHTIRARVEQGRIAPRFWLGILAIALVPVAAFLASGAPIQLERPALTGFNFSGGMVVIPELVAMVIALSLFGGAFIAEIIRAGILSVAHGQLEAAAALGLHRHLQMRLVVLPQALRVIVPPLTSEYLNLIKNSSLASAIAYPDLVQVFAGTVLNQTGQAVEIIAITMLVYFLISIGVSGLMHWLNRAPSMGRA